MNKRLLTHIIAGVIMVFSLSFGYVYQNRLNNKSSDYKEEKEDKDKEKEENKEENKEETTSNREEQTPDEHDFDYYIYSEKVKYLKNNLTVYTFTYKKQNTKKDSEEHIIEGKDLALLITYLEKIKGKDVIFDEVKWKETESIEIRSIDNRDEGMTIYPYKDSFCMVYKYNGRLTSIVFNEDYTLKKLSSLS